MSQQHASRLGGRAGGVDERRRVVGLNTPGFLVKRPGDAPPAEDRLMPAVADIGERDNRRRACRQRPDRIHHDNGTQGRALGDGQQRVQHRARRHDRNRRLAVAKHDADLLARKRRIERGRHGAGGQDREVGEQPLRPALRQQQNAIATRHSERCQPEAQVAHAIDEIAAARPRDAVARRAADQLGPWIPAGREERQVRERSECQYPRALSTTFSNGSPRRKRPRFSTNTSTIGVQ